jgi:membrane fusion protein, multidrug efflux system
MKETPMQSPGSSTRAEDAAKTASTRRKVWTAALVVVLVAAWLLLKGGRQSAPTGGPPTIPVSAGAARLGDIDIYLDALGSVTPVTTVSVTSRVSGQVTEVAFREGQGVAKGDLLAVIDPRPYEALLLQARGQLERDQALLRNATLDLGRYRNAFAQHAVSAQQVATQEALVDQYQGIVTLDQGNAEAARLNVEFCRIVSPVGGRVGLRQVDPGNLVAAGGTTAIAVVTQMRPITVVFNLAEDVLAQVQRQPGGGAGLPVLAYDRSQQVKLAEGTLLTIDNVINPSTGTFRARALFANSRDELFPNQFVNVRLRVRTLRQAILVPSAAIQRNGDAAFAYVIGPDSTVKLRPLKVLDTEGEIAAVTGVDAGEKLVTDGFDKLLNGTRVSVRAPSSQGRAAVKGE